MRVSLLSSLLLTLALRAADPAPPVPVADPHALTPVQRMDFARVIIPMDPGNGIHRKLPHARLLDDTELQQTFRELQQASHLGNVTWTDLMSNFALRGRYAEAQECLAQARRRDDFKENAALLAAWFTQMEGDHRKALPMFEELITQEPADLSLRQHRAGCLAALYRPTAAGKAVREISEMKHDVTPWIEHMRGVLAVLDSDWPEAKARFLASIRASPRGKEMPEACAGLALVERAAGGHEEAVGWLRRAMASPDSRFRLVLVNQPVWSPLWDDAMFQEAVARHHWPFYPTGTDTEAILAARTAGALELQSMKPPLVAVPTPLQLREHQPGTRVRTLTGKLTFDTPAE